MQIQFPFFDKGIYHNKPSGLISLRQFINATMNPKPKLLKAFKDIQTAAEKGDLKEKDRLKQNELFFVTPTIILEGTRKYENILGFNPFLVIEYDKIPYPELLRDYVFDKFKNCIFSFLSPSGTGCKYVFHIPVSKSIEEYKEFFWAIAYDLDKFVGLDFASSNASLPLFVSHDKDAKFREDATVSTRRGFAINAFDASNIVSEVNIEGTCSEEQAEKCFALIRNMINGIESDGHLIVRKSAVILGGLCAHYDIDEELAWEELESLIRDNAYLSKGIPGYLKTARTMLDRGLYSPFPLNDDKN